MILKLINKIRDFSRRKILKRYATVGKGLINRGIRLRVDIPSDRKVMDIGDDCIISGHFVFESKFGFIKIGNHSYLEEVLIFAIIQLVSYYSDAKI